MPREGIITRSGWLKLAIFALIAAGLGWGLGALGVDLRQFTPERLRELVLSFGIWAPVIYIAVYGQPVIPLPASIMTLTGGLAFGPFWGGLAALVGATIRAASQFLVARLLGREFIEKLLKGAAAKFDDKIAQAGFTTVLLIRLIPNVPFDAQNYLLGFSKVRFLPYVAGSFLGMIPGSFAYTLLGDSLSDPRQFWKLGLAIGVIVALIVAQRIWKAKHGATLPAPASAPSTRALR